MERQWWRALDHAIDELFPRFKVNVFIQYKRPWYLTTKRAKEWSYWGRRYFSYDMDRTQQKALESLERKIGTKAIVTYACPAFSTLACLWDAYRSRQLVQKTNFAQPIKLRGHRKYTYADAGRTGMAYSEPEKVEGYSLEERFDELMNGDYGSQSNRQFVIDLGNTIHEVAADAEDRYQTYNDRVVYLAESVTDIDLALALIRIDSFCFVTRTRWMIGYTGEWQP